MKQCIVCKSTDKYYAKGMCKSCYGKDTWKRLYAGKQEVKEKARKRSHESWLKNKERISEQRKKKRLENLEETREYFANAQRRYRLRLKKKGLTDNELYLFGGLKKLVYERDNYQCCDCGITNEKYLKKGHGMLHVHHIDNTGFGKPIAEKNNDINNLVTLCNVCHSRETQRILRGHKPRTLEDFKK